jgi:hypothetical protein
VKTTGQHCRSGCREKSHESYGACLRDAHLGVNLQVTPSSAWDRELALYESAKRQGISPAGTSTAKIREALDVSDRTGVAYDATRGPIENGLVSE